MALLLTPFKMKVSPLKGRWMLSPPEGILGES